MSGYFNWQAELEQLRRDSAGWKARAEGAWEVRDAARTEATRLRAALEDARDALHRACLTIGSTDGHRADFDAINRALDA